MNPAAILLILGAVTLDILANVLLKRSDGFRHRRPGLAAIALILLAFTLLGVAVQHMPVAVAYAAWGGLGIVLTALISVFYLKQSLDLAALAGIALIVAGVVVMNTLSNTVSH